MKASVYNNYPSDSSLPFTIPSRNILLPRSGLLLPILSNHLDQGVFNFLGLGGVEIVAPAFDERQLLLDGARKPLDLLLRQLASKDGILGSLHLEKVRIPFTWLGLFAKNSPASNELDT